MSWSRWRGSVGLGEGLIFLFLLAFVRQYFWLVHSNRLAWTCTAITSVVIWFLYLKFKGPEPHRILISFWLIVALPLLLYYSLRVPFPDLSYDVWNYRLVQSERALRGIPFMPGDFFPVIFPLNPSPDLVTGIPRHFLGYRLGTVVNYLILVWLGLILNKLLREIIRNDTVRAIAILLILVSEHMLFLINTYMVDLLALPLIVDAARLTLSYRTSENKQRDLVFVAFLLGSSMALKLSNVTVVVPVALWIAFEYFAVQRRLNRTQLMLLISAIVVFFLPMVPHAMYIYRETGSPFFPLYNELLQSPYWPNVNVGDGRWGPHGWIETLTWPLLTFRNPQRLSELNLYSGRLSVCIIAALLCAFLPRTPRSMRALALVVLLGSLIWSGTSGYIRYALVLEVLGGVLTFYLVVELCSWLAGRSKPLRLALTALPILILVSQSVLAVTFAYQTEWSGRRTFFYDPESYLDETRHFFHDHNLSKFLAPDKKPLFWNVDAWIVSNVKSSGLEVLLRNDVPMIGIHNREYFDTPNSLQRFRRVVATHRGKRIYTLVLATELEAARTNLRLRGFELGEPNQFPLKIYSNRSQVEVLLFEVRTAPSLPPKPTEPVKTAATGALAFEALDAELAASGLPASLPRGTKQTINVSIRNASEFVWPALGQADGRFFINIANAWYDNEDKLVTNLDGRSNIPFDLWPGDKCDVTLQITAPSSPGEYTLELDMVQEGVAFFQGKGSTVFRAKVKVE